MDYDALIENIIKLAFAEYSEEQLKQIIHDHDNLRLAISKIMAAIEEYKKGGRY